MAECIRSCQFRNRTPPWQRPVIQQGARVRANHPRGHAAVGVCTSDGLIVNEHMQVKPYYFLQANPAYLLEKAEPRPTGPTDTRRFREVREEIPNNIQLSSRSSRFDIDRD